MKAPIQSIFRPEAVRRYRQRQQESVLPRFTRPLVLLCLWFLLGLLGLGGVAAWLARVPVYVAGQAIIVQEADPSQEAPDNLKVVAFLPAEYLPRLRPGQTLFLHLDQPQLGDRVKSSIRTVEPDLWSPEKAQRRFAAGSAASVAITRPAAVVSTHWEPVVGGQPGSAYLGSVLPVEVELGSRRMLSLLPFIGGLWERSSHEKF